MEVTPALDVMAGGSGGHSGSALRSSLLKAPIARLGAAALLISAATSGVFGGSTFTRAPQGP